MGGPALKALVVCCGASLPVGGGAHALLHVVVERQADEIVQRSAAERDAQAVPARTPCAKHFGRAHPQGVRDALGRSPDGSSNGASASKPQWLSGFSEAEQADLSAYLERLHEAVEGDGTRGSIRPVARSPKAE